MQVKTKLRYIPLDNNGGIEDVRSNSNETKDNIYIDMQAGRNLLPKLLVADN